MRRATDSTGEPRGSATRYGERRAIDFAALTVIGCVSLYAMAMFSVLGILYVRPTADPITVTSLVLTSTSGVAAGLYVAMKQRETNAEVRRIAQHVGPRTPRPGQVRSQSGS